MKRFDYQPKPEFKTEMDFTKAELAAAARAMERELEQEPELNDFGFGSHSHSPQTHAEFVRDNRKRIREPRSLAQFIAARGWLRQFDKLKALNQRGSSYGLKHVAEHGVGYITNGVFIAAAIAEGFTVKRIDNGPNAWINISTRAWTQSGY